VLSRWEFGPVVTVAAVVFAVLYLEGAFLVAKRHPARPWPWWRTGMFLGGLAVIAAATESGIGVYDGTLFWVHMIQHLMLIMIAPAMLVVGQPVTLLMHASRNPVHTWGKKLLRSRVVTWITWPPFGVALYTATVVGTHLTGFMNLVQTNGAVHEAEHALYLIAGYLYFLPLIGREPIRWRVSYPTRLFLLFVSMPVDAFTGVALGSEHSNPFPGLAQGRPAWAPSPVDDVHIGGAVMWVGGAGIMFALILTVFFAWSRETRADGGLGWLEAARRSNFAALVGSHPDAGDAGAAHEAAQPSAASADSPGNAENVDDDEHLAAYNAFLARINKPPGS
jgi:putative copper resistance protein D